MNTVNPSSNQSTSTALSQIFAFDDNMVRVAGTPDRPLFVAADVCRALELDQVTRAIEGLDADDLTKIKVIDGLGRTQEVNAITEPGLYMLIFRSNKPKAATFRRWVTRDVLPSIRKTGQYGGSDERVLLWDAFKNSKAVSAQLVILQGLGYGQGVVSPVPTQPQGAAGLNPVDAKAFWKAVGLAFTEGKAKREWFICRAGVAPNDPAKDWFELFIHPDPVIQVARALNPEWRRAQTRDFMAGLKASIEWMPLPLRKSFGPVGRTVNMACWGFTVTHESGEELLGLCAQLAEPAN